MYAYQTSVKVIGGNLYFLFKYQFKYKLDIAITLKPNYSSVIILGSDFKFSSMLYLSVFRAYTRKMKLKKILNPIFI